MNRGSMHIGIYGDLMASRFNEAPIHESGKSKLFGAISNHAPRFNEAPIHESGKCLCGLPGR